MASAYFESIWLSETEIDEWEAACFLPKDPSEARELRHAEALGPLAGSRSVLAKRRRLARQRGELEHSFRLPPHLPAPPSRWELFAAALLRREGAWRAAGRAPQRRRLSIRDVRKWERRHGPCAEQRATPPWEARGRGALLRREARRAGEGSRGSSAVAIYKELRRAPLKTAAICRELQREHRRAKHAAANPAAAAPHGEPEDPWASLRAADDFVPNDDEAMAAALDMDVATFRMLRELEGREISPEDYDLLGCLDETVRPRTLDAARLGRFPIVTYCARSCGMVCCEEQDEEEGGGASRAACGVCLVDLQDGEELRMLLPCRHLFHRGCVDRWLLEASTCCPVDKRDLA